MASSCLVSDNKPQSSLSSIPTLKNQRPLELLKTCIVLYISDSPSNLSFPLRLTSFILKIKQFVHEIAKEKAYLCPLLTIPPITNQNKLNHQQDTTDASSRAYTLQEILTSSTAHELQVAIKQILFEMGCITTKSGLPLIQLSKIMESTCYFTLDAAAEPTVIQSCDVSAMKDHFKSLLLKIKRLSPSHTSKRSPVMPKKRTWHELHDEDLLFSSNFYYPLSKRRRVDIDDSTHNEKILQRIPLSIPSSTKLVTEIQDEISDLLDYKSHKNMSHLDASREIIDILRTPTTKEILVHNLYSTKNDAAVNEFCPMGTKYQCKIHRRSLNPMIPLLSLRECDKIHFIRIMRQHTMPTLGDCSYLDGCRHMDTCRFIHYVVDEESVSKKRPYFRARKYLNRLLRQNRSLNKPINDVDMNQEAMDGMESDSSVNTQVLNEQIYQNPAIHRYQAQWINCDVRALEFNVLNKYGVIMADPPWDIHMELPYGTLTDEEMMDLGVGRLADDNCLLFLWVTGRVMETARKCMKKWGFECQEEVLWIKTNQLQRIIRTGRTGHWLNHSKEHCLVGVKGNDVGWNRCLDCDVIVAEVRETSRKPDEIYNLIERLSPGTEKIEMFGRPHNARPGWMTLGNQLNGTRILDQGIYSKFHELYPTIQVKTSVDNENENENEKADVQSDSENSSSSSEGSRTGSESSDTGTGRSDDETESNSYSSNSEHSSSSYSDSGSQSDSDSQSESENDSKGNGNSKRK